MCNKTRADCLLGLRPLLDDLSANGHHLQPDLIRREDFPPRPQYLPRPLSPQDDQLLQQELRRSDDLPSNALLLTRATGIRIGEGIDLALDCLRQLGPDQWALQVPLGKLHTERLAPADAEVRRIRVMRMSLCPSNCIRAGRRSLLSLPTRATSAALPGIRQALAATRHLLEMYRRSLPDEKTRRGLQRLDHRLLAAADRLGQIAPAAK